MWQTKIEEHDLYIVLRSVAILVEPVLSQCFRYFLGKVIENSDLCRLCKALNLNGLGRMSRIDTTISGWPQSLCKATALQIAQLMLSATSKSEKTKSMNIKAIYNVTFPSFVHLFNST